jgi:hypothetical protein
MWFTGPPGSSGAAQLKLLPIIGRQDLSVRANAGADGLPAAESRPAPVRDQLRHQPSAHPPSRAPGQHAG